MTETENSKKLCADCKTSTTPLWRCGPTGPKSLCNACGIRFKKKGTGSTLGVNKGSSDKKKEKPSASPASSSTSTTAKTTISGTYEKGNDGKTSVHDSYKKGIDEKTSVSKGKEGTLDGNLRMRLMGSEKEVVLLRRPRSPMKRQRTVKKLGEVEQAALLLMALSYGSVYA